MASWVGYGLSAGVDTYFKARDQAAREDELQQVAQLRALQAERIRRQMADEELSQQGAEELAQDHTASTVTLAEGTPDIAPTVKEEVTSQEPGIAGGYAPDAAIGPSLPSKVTATPGQPGQKPITMSGMTEADAIRKLGAKKYAAMMRTPEGREALKQAGLITQADLAVRQKRATVTREYEGMLRESRALVDAGDPVGALYKEAAARERLAETTDNESLQMHYRDRATQLRDQARSVAQNEAEKKLLAEDMKGMADASKELMDNPGPAAYANYLTTMRSAKSAIGQQRGMEMMGRIGLQQLEKMFTNPAEQQFWTAVSKDMSEAHSLDMPGSIKRVLAAMDPQARAQIIPSLIKADIPQVNLALGLGPGKQPKNVWDAVHGLALAKGLKEGTPEYGQFLLNKVAEFHKAEKVGGDAKAALLKELMASERELAKEFSDQGKQLKNMMTMPPQQRQELLADRERTRIALQGIRKQIGTVSEGKINMLGDPRQIYDAAAQRHANTAKALAGIKDGDDLKNPANAEKVRKYNREFKRLMEAEGLDPMSRPAAEPTQ